MVFLKPLKTKKNISRYSFTNLMSLLSKLVSPIPHFALGALVGVFGEKYCGGPDLASAEMALASGAVGLVYGASGAWLFGTSWTKTAGNTVACGLGYAAGHAVYRFFS